MMSQYPSCVHIDLRPSLPPRGNHKILRRDDGRGRSIQGRDEGGNGDDYKFSRWLEYRILSGR